VLAEAKVGLADRIHVQAHGLGHSLGKLLRVHFLFATIQGVVEERQNKRLGLAQAKHRGLQLLGVVLLTVSRWAPSWTVGVGYVHQDIVAG
jgi:hypothetical protein